VLSLETEPKQMMRAESTNTCTTGIHTNHSTIFALLVELSVIYAQKWMATIRIAKLSQ